MGKPLKVSLELKAKVMLEIVSGEKSLAQASRDYRIKGTVLHRWQVQFLEGLPEMEAVVPTGVITIWITRMFCRFASCATCARLSPGASRLVAASVYQ